MRYSPMPAFVKDADGRYLFANATMERIFGFTLAEVQHRSDVEFLSTPAELHSHDRKALETGRPVETVATVSTADGSVHHFLVIRFPFAQRDGRQVVGGVAVDVTELKQAELRVGESERRYGIWSKAARG